MGVQTLPNRTSNRARIRRRRQKRSVWRKNVLPFIKLFVVIAISIFVIIEFGYKVVRPFALLNREHRDMQRLTSQLAVIKKENTDLERRIKFLNTKRGAAQAARKLGYVKPGEITIVLPKEEPSDTLSQN